MKTVSRLAGILILGFCLRLAAVNFGLPDLFHSDEPIVVNHALAYGGGDFNPHFFKIPPLASYLLFTAFGFIFLAGKLAGFFVSPADFERLFYSDPTLFYLSGRVLLGVIPGTLCIVALYRMAKKYFSETAAFAAALFLAVCFLHVRDSHYIYADMLLNFLLIVGLCRCLKDDLSARSALISGIWIGAATAAKYNGAVLSVVYVFYLIIRYPQFLVRNLLIAAPAAGFTFVLLNPFSFFDKKNFLVELAAQGNAQGGTPFLHHLTYSLPEALGLLILGAALIGLIEAIFSKDARLKALAFFILLYYAVLVRAGQSYDRYVLPMLPVLCLFAALVWDGRFRGKNLVRGVFLVALIFVPLSKSVYWDLLMSRPDTRTLSKSWIEQNISAGSAVALEWEFYSPRLRFTKVQLEEKKRELHSGEHSAAQARKLDFLISQDLPGYKLHFLVQDVDQDRFLFGKPVVAYDFQALKARGIEYVLTAEFAGKAVAPEFFRQLEAEAEKVKTWSPYVNPSQTVSSDPQPLTGGPFTTEDIFGRTRNGYFLTLYRIKS